MEAIDFKLFDPKIGNLDSVPSMPGNYIVVLRKNRKLPSLVIHINIVYSKFEGYDVIYTGLASNSLRDRDVRKHFNGTAGNSTLRKSLGCLFGYNLIPRDSNYAENKKTKFNDIDEEKLSDWMKENLLLFYYPNNNYTEVESYLIQQLNPPLNLDKNNNIINLDFRKYLSQLRNIKPNCEHHDTVVSPQGSSRNSLYTKIWQKYLLNILAALEKNGNTVKLDQSLFESAGNRTGSGYSFRLDITNGDVPRKSGSAVARDLKGVLDGSAKFNKIAQGKHIIIRLDKGFNLIVQVI